MAHLTKGAGFFPCSPGFAEGAVPWRTVWVTLETGGRGASGLQILNQGQSEEKSEGLEGSWTISHGVPTATQGTRGPGGGRGWRAQSSLEECLLQEGLNNETLQLLLTEPLSEGCL